MIPSREQLALALAVAILGVTGRSSSEDCEGAPVEEVRTRVEISGLDGVTVRRERPASTTPYCVRVGESVLASELVLENSSTIVTSHPSKVELVRKAVDLGYLVFLHTILVPEDLAVARVVDRVENGGHGVPENKIRERYRRLRIARLLALLEEADARLEGEDPTAASAPTDDDGT